MTYSNNAKQHLNEAARTRLSSGRSLGINTFSKSLFQQQRQLKIHLEKGAVTGRILRTPHKIRQSVVDEGHGTIVIQNGAVATILTKTEAVVNSRPFTYHVYREIGEHEPFWLSLFWSGKRLTCIPISQTPHLVDRNKVPRGSR